jgi:PEP-CTERM motif
MRRLLLVLLAACGFAPVAYGETFKFTYSGPSALFGTVLISGSEASPGAFDITSGTDVVTGGSSLTGIFSVVPNPSFPSPSLSAGGRFNYDNALFPSSTAPVDHYGLLFGNSSGQINLYSNGGEFLAGNSVTPGAEDVVVTLSQVSAVPEPGSLAVLSFGMISVLVAHRRRALQDAS